jgi:hypothetical protein
LALGAWLTKDRWIRHFQSKPAAAAQQQPAWQPLTLLGEQRAQRALDSLAATSGPVFVNVSAGDASAYVFRALTGKLPDEADSVEAAVIGDRLRVRGAVRVRELGVAAVLGPLAAVFGERERLQLAGTFHVIRPGLSEFQVKEMMVRDFSTPPSMIPKLLRAIVKGDPPPGLSEDGLAVATPPHLGDVRISNGHVTLYKGRP